MNRWQISHFQIEKCVLWVTSQFILLFKFSEIYNGTLQHCSNYSNLFKFSEMYNGTLQHCLKKLGKMSYPNSYVSHTSYASPLYLDPWHQVDSDLSHLENMLDDSGSAETETFPTDDDETEAFPSDQGEPDSTTNNPLLGNVQYHIQVLVFLKKFTKN